MAAAEALAETVGGTPGPGGLAAQLRGTPTRSVGGQPLRPTTGPRQCAGAARSVTF